ncbi:hypothetical protein FW320_13005 [Azospirillum sp. Vi22]|uniref:hypothetical protein n=1 Tax=Azospirillum baldaniorum TaxID=1064539 RepID=UPI00157B15CA|nr:hypothetical protein [Azospirillum baldaniorum]NUB07090.1 hypothetical protein [Azospirillum baldaniorum]
MPDPVTTINAVLRAVLPPGVPPSFRRVLAARFDGAGRRRIVVADLEMVDGLTATVEAWHYAPGGWAHRWLAMAGGPMFWNGRRWQREEPQPRLPGL